MWVEKVSGVEGMEMRGRGKTRREGRARKPEASRILDRLFHESVSKKLREMLRI